MFHKPFEAKLEVSLKILLRYQNINKILLILYRIVNMLKVPLATKGMNVFMV